MSLQINKTLPQEQQVSPKWKAVHMALFLYVRSGRLAVASGPYMTQCIVFSNPLKHLRERPSVWERSSNMKLPPIYDSKC